MTDQKRPAGVDPSALEAGGESLLGAAFGRILRSVDPGSRDEIAEGVRAHLAVDAKSIGRRAARKILHHLGAAGLSLPETQAVFASLIEAEVRSTWGTPTPGEVTIRLSHREALRVADLVARASNLGTPATERAILSEIRRKFFASIGIVTGVSSTSRTRKAEAPL